MPLKWRKFGVLSRPLIALTLVVASIHPSVSNADICNTAQIEILHDHLNPLQIEGWETPAILDAFLNGVRGPLIVVNKGHQLGPTDVYLEMDAVPKESSSSSSWIFLRQKETLFALNDRFIKADRPVLLNLPRPQQGLAYTAMVQTRPRLAFVDYWECLSRPSQLALIVTPATDYWTLIHEEKHFVDLESGLWSAVERKLREILPGATSIDTAHAAAVILTFIFEQRAHHEVLQKMSLAEGPQQEFRYELPPSYWNLESPFIGGSISRVSSEQAHNNQKNLGMDNLDYYGDRLGEVLDSIRTSHRDTYGKVLEVIRSNVAKSDAYTLDRFVENHFSQEK